MAVGYHFFSFLLYYLSSAAGIVPLWAGRKTRNLIWYYVLASLVCDVLCLLLKRWGMDIRWLGNVFFLAEYIFLSVFYLKLVLPDRLWVRLMLIVIPFLFLGLPLLRGIGWNAGFKELNTTGGALFAAVFVVYAITGYYRLLQAPGDAPLEHSALFWMHTALLIYASGSALFFLYDKYMHSVYPQYTVLWGTYFHVLNTVKNLFMAFYFYLLRNRRFSR